MYSPGGATLLDASLCTLAALSTSSRVCCLWLHSCCCCCCYCFFLVVKPHCYAQHKNAACCYWCSVISVCVCGTQLWGLQNGWSCHLGSALGVTRTHAHTALCPGLPGSAGARNVKPIWILLKQQTVSGISWAKCKSASHSRQITTPAPHHSVFTGRMPFLPPNQQHQSTEGSWTQRDYTKNVLSVAVGMSDYLNNCYYYCWINITQVDGYCCRYQRDMGRLWLVTSGTST